LRGSLPEPGQVRTPATPTEPGPPPLVEPCGIKADRHPTEHQKVVGEARTHRHDATASAALPAVSGAIAAVLAAVSAEYVFVGRTEHRAVGAGIGLAVAAGLAALSGYLRRRPLARGGAEPLMAAACVAGSLVA